MKKSIDISMLPSGVMLWTIQDVEKALQIKKSKIYNMINAGKIRTVKIEGATRFLPSDVMEYVRQNIY